MTPERWQKIKALFSSAQDRAPDERERFLARECAGDDDLRAEVERLLDSAREDSFLEDSAIGGAVSMFAQRTGEAVSEDPLSAGTFLNSRYEVIRQLGRGGMGEVYLANDTRINRRVALKVLHPDLVSSKDSLRRFALEAQAASALNHPHIMTIYEFDTSEDGSLFIVAEYIKGRTLNRLIGREMSVDRILDIAMQAASALAAAHDAGITHRDVKPENIMVRDDGYVKVLDFGLAKLAPSGSAHESSGPEEQTKALHRTKPGAVMGTAAYMSPEQARGLAVDHRSDIWSLGVVLYEMLTGNRPFSGSTPADIIVSVLTYEPPPVSELQSGMPPEVDWIVSKALAKDAEERYQTFKELRADLEKVRKKMDFEGQSARSLRSLPEGEGRVGSGSTFGEAGHTTQGDSPDETDAHSKLYTTFSSIIHEPRRHKGALAVIGLLLVSIISFGSYLAFSGVSRPPGVDSIAVLPFADDTGSPDLAYLAEGLSESVIDRLSTLPQLKVISRNSSFKFRGPDVDPLKAAAQLGVSAVVTGKVTRVGDNIVVRIDLVDARGDRQLFGGQRIRRLSDIPDLANDISISLIEPLRLKLNDTQAGRLAQRNTENSEAYRYYLSGLVSFGQTDEEHARARRDFEKAIELDPNFASAYVELAWTYWAEANSTGDPLLLGAKAKAAVEKALALDPDLAKAHVLMATVHELEFDWPAAEAEYKKAIEISPNYDFARNNYAFFLSVLGRQGEALAQIEEQRTRDPLNQWMFLLYKAAVLVQGRSFDEALQAYQQARAADPSKDVPDFAIGYAYGGKGLNDDAARYYKKAVAELGGDNTYSQPLVYLAIAYAAEPGKEAEARALLRRIESMRPNSPALLAAVYSSLGDRDKAMELLEDSYVKRDLLLRYIKTGYEYDGLRSDPRFQDLLRRMNLGSR